MRQTGPGSVEGTHSNWERLSTSLS